MDYFTLSRNWFNYSFENPEKVKPNHTALYFFCIEHCNRLGWKIKFGLPTTMAKEAIGIKSYNTYISTLNDLVDWGFLKMIEKSKNQYSSNIIALSVFNKALDKALDKALIKHASKQSESTHQSIDSINIQDTNIQDADIIYKLYPSKCINSNRSTGKCSKDRERIIKLLKSNSKEYLIKIIESYVNECINSKTYLKNFTTFLNNLPEYSIGESVIRTKPTKKMQTFDDIKVK
jgi:hypothetical protein